MLMIGLLKMESDGATSNSLTKLLMGALTVNCNLDEAAISSKLLCFGVDRVAAFQGKKMGVTKQIIDEHALLCPSPATGCQVFEQA
jgi:hypothetical protein